MKKIIVLGSTGQLGSELKDQAANFSDSFEFTFLDKNTVDLSSKHFIEELSKFDMDYLINAAAYTKVDQAEKEANLCYTINTNAVELLSEYCSKNNITLIHISTDYVYHNYKNRPLKETDVCLPAGVYARSKYFGELSIQANLKNYYVFRTSWIYSAYGNNFIKTMLRLGEKMDTISVVDDQVGTPTYGKDIAFVILQSIVNQIPFGIYNFSNQGSCTWNTFAQFIFETKGKKVKTDPISTEKFNAPAPRPAYSIMDNEKLICELPELTQYDWKERVFQVLRKL